MLKSTHRAGAPASSAIPLPSGWTEHRAPTGHPYYYHAETKQSTYTRPVEQTEPEELVIDYGATQPDREVQAGFNAMQEFHKHNDPTQVRPGSFTGGRGYQDRDRTREQTRPNRQGDRAKSKTAIPNCAPWLLVKTKYGRRFVHNTDTNESLWKFPSDVMMAVIEMDRLEWEKKKQAEEQKEQEVAVRAEPVEVNRPKAATPVLAKQDDPQEYDSDEYEEVEVTDDEAEGEDQSVKRPRLEEPSEQSAPNLPPNGPQEFDEDDIAWQLAQMEADEDDPGYDYELDDQDLDEDGGIPLTAEDREAMFRTLLDQFQISPFSTFDALIDTNTTTANAVISDDRWTALPNMATRRTAFDTWSRDRVAERNAIDGPDGNGTNGTAKKEKLDPRIAYLRFLARETTTKLYWPEFKRKFKKMPEMTDRYFPDRDREKLYREYTGKLKMSDSDRKKEFTSLLKSASLNDWTNDDVPEKIEKDVRYYGIRDEERRKELVDAFIATLKR